MTFLPRLFISSKGITNSKNQWNVPSMNGPLRSTLGEQEDIPVSLSSLHISGYLLTEMHVRTEKDLFFSPTDIHRPVNNGDCHTGGWE